eukprot:6461112-Pyramimonas_sp.AAC.1
MSPKGKTQNTGRVRGADDDGSGKHNRGMHGSAGIIRATICAVSVGGDPEFPSIGTKRDSEDGGASSSFGSPCECRGDCACAVSEPLGARRRWPRNAFASRSERAC